MRLAFLAVALTATAAASPLVSPSKATGNDDPCDPCQPQGATGINPPAVGTGLSALYIDVLSSVKDIHFRKRSIEPRAQGFCCRRSLNCVNVQNLNIPMCYDKFTTNFAFTDGSYGSLTTGEYKSGSASANLLTGDYSSGSDQGNIYASDTQAKPNTATLSIPPQYTGTGVGSAIPASELGSIIVYTTTIPGATYTAPTVIGPTVRVATVSGHVLSVTVSAKTITAATTIEPLTTVVTATAAAAASSKAAAAQVAVDSTQSVAMSILGAFLYVFHVLI